MYALRVQRSAPLHQDLQAKERKGKRQDRLMQVGVGLQTSSFSQKTAVLSSQTLATMQDTSILQPDLLPPAHEVSHVACSDLLIAPVSFSATMIPIAANIAKRPLFSSRFRHSSSYLQNGK